MGHSKTLMLTISILYSTLFISKPSLVSHGPHHNGISLAQSKHNRFRVDDTRAFKAESDHTSHSLLASRKNVVNKIDFLLIRCMHFP